LDLKICNFGYFCAKRNSSLTVFSLAKANDATLKKPTSWLPTGRFLAPIFIFKFQKTKYMALFSCSLRTELSVQVAHYYRHRFVISAQTLSFIILNAILSAVKRKSQL